MTQSESARAKHFALDILKSAYAESSAVSFGGSPDAPWPAIFRLASAESCLAALCDCVLSRRAGQLGDVEPLLTLFRDKGRERNSKIAEILKQSLVHLNSGGVEAVAIKGASFLAMANACSRSMADIDLLIRPIDADEASEVLEREGYKLAEQADWYKRLNHHHAPPIFDPSGAITVELHTRLAPDLDKYRISADAILAGAQIGFLDGSRVSVPSDTDRVVHLILHSMIADRGYWQTTMRLRDLMDLLEIQKAGRVDWRALQATFAEIGYLSRAAGFLLAAELLLSPAFRAPDWAVSGRRWADRAVRGFFDPDFSRGRRAAAQLLADIEVIVQNPRRLRIVLLPERLKRFVAARCLSIVNGKTASAD